jgi:hypothetical protein
MDRVTYAGTGNEGCKTPHQLQVRWNNVKVDEPVILGFITHLTTLDPNYDGVQVSANRQVSIRDTSCSLMTGTLGVAWFDIKLVEIFRPSVWVWLHELAHIGACCKTDCRNHDARFSSELDYLYKLFIRWIKTGHAVEKLTATPGVTKLVVVKSRKKE